MDNLDKNKTDIKKNLDKHVKITDKKQLEEIERVEVNHTKGTKMISLKVPIHDLESIKAKAAKIGIPYQIYIKMLIRKDITA